MTRCRPIVGSWRALRFIFAVLGAVSVLALGADGQTPATMVNPVAGQQNVGATVTFQWTAATSAQAYYLYVGTTEGADDVVNTGALQGTSYTPTSPLPAGATLWARIWTELGGHWYYSPDVSFTVSPDAALISPGSGQQNVPANATFQWTSAPSAQGYYLYVGTTEGADNVVNTGTIQGTSYTVTSPLPVGATLWARIWTELAGGWYYQTDVSFTVSAAAALISPRSAQQNVPAYATFQWTSAPAAQAYYLDVGTTEGGNDIVNTGAIQSTSYTPRSPLPIGATLWARVWTELGGHWYFEPDVSFTVSPDAALVSPVSGQQNVPGLATFQWTSAPSAQGYYLYVGTTEGADNVVNTGTIQGTSYTVASPLPIGATLWARLYTELGGIWSFQADVSFTVSPAAVLLSPAAGAQNVLVRASFQWTSAPSAQAYYLYVGTSEGADDVVNTGEIQVTSYSPSTMLPAGATLWARIWTELGGHWYYANDVSFTVSAAALLLSPTSGQQNVIQNPTFQWNAVAGAQGYTLWVGTSEGAQDVLYVTGLQGASYTPSALLPAGATLWARLYTELNGIWSYQYDVAFTVTAAPPLVFPARGQQNIDTSLPFTWQSGAGAQGYQLYVGTSPGASDLVHSGVIQSTSWSVPPLPVGQTLYARIWSEIGGTWSYPYDVAFTARPRFGYPAVRSMDIDPTQAFTWSPAYGGSGVYYIYVGTSPGASDLYAETPVSSNSVTLPASALPAGKTLYARVILKPANGQDWLFDTVFTVAGTAITPATIVYPPDGDTTADVSQPFQWTPTDLAEAYRLEIFDASGSQVLDTGAITVPRYFDETLPLGSYTGQLGTEIAGTWYWTSFSFVVTNTGYNMTNEQQSALWATDFVRTMADLNNYTYAWTELAARVASPEYQQVGSSCGTYRDVLLDVLSQMNVTARLPADEQPHLISIGFLEDGADDAHTLVEFWNSDLQRWMLLDPTFDLTATRASDGTYATKEDINAATLNQQWTAISYQFLGSWGDQIAKNYYLDYPLLYLNLAVPPPNGIQDPMPYLVAQPPPPLTTTATAIYTFNCSGSTTLLINGSPQPINCTGPYDLTVMTEATSVALPSGSTAAVNIYSPVRNVF
jgi:hypothetical protein